MHVLMLLSKPVSEDTRVVHEADTLAAAGHQVTVAQWARRDPQAPREERLGPLRVLRVPNTPLMRVLPHDVLRNPFWWYHATRLGLRLHRGVPFDVVHCHDLDTLAAGVRLKRRLGVHLVFDAHEHFSDMIRADLAAPLPALAERLERRLLRHVDLVITVSEHLGGHYRRHVDVPVVVVLNAFGDPPRTYRPPTEGAFTVTYIGTLTRDRLFPGLVPAIGALEGVRLRVGGKREGAYQEVEQAAARQSNVDFLGPVSVADVLPITRAGHAVLCMLDPENPQYRTAIATKVYDAMGCGRPIVVSEGTAMGDFVREHGIGLVVPYDAAALAGAIAELRDDPTTCRALGERGLALARSTYNWRAQAERLLEGYGQIRAMGR